MKVIIGILFIFISCNACADSFENHEFFYGYLSGTYHVIGKAIDSQLTYHGKIQLISNKTHLVVVRHINGKKVFGIGHIEHALGNDSINVLRVRFKEESKKYEATDLWQSDFDNYARLSGYVYPIGNKRDSSGMEALFIDH